MQTYINSFVAWAWPYMPSQFLGLSDAAQLAVIVSIAPTIASMGALFASILGAHKSKENGKKVDTVIEKTTEIHTLTNSNLTKVQSDLSTAIQEIHGLKELVAELRKPGPVQDVHVINTEKDVVPVAVVKERK